MGVDGSNYLQIRGSEEILNRIEQTEAVIETNEECAMIAKRFFQNGEVQITHRSPTYLVMKYEFRNSPIYSYLEELLRTYPTCWFKNEYSTEIGACGMWIGRYRGKEMYVQKLEWEELGVEEQAFETDFSRDPSA